MSVKVRRERPDQRRHHRVTAPLYVTLAGHTQRAADWSLALQMEDTGSGFGRMESRASTDRMDPVALRAFPRAGVADLCAHEGFQIGRASCRERV